MKRMFKPTLAMLLSLILLLSMFPVITMASTASKNVTYMVGTDETLTFNAEDFNTVCEDETGSTLSYVKFSLPVSTCGTLYYNYTSSSSYTDIVSTSTKYYYGQSYYLSRVTFVPYSGYIGTFSFSYTAYSTSGNTYTGAIEITVQNNSGTVSAIKYATDENEDITFNKSDFYNLCYSYSGEGLNYVKFTTLPSSSYGTLYYYTSATTSVMTKVTTSTKCYYSSTTNSLSRVTFVPKSGYNGTVTIPYTGYNYADGTYTGTVKIAVGSGNYDVDTIYYTTEVGENITFAGGDFNSLSRSYLGSTLSYVRFTTLPSSSYGTLYYYSSSSSSTKTKLSTSTSCYYSSSINSLSKVVFVPKSDYEGTVTIPYMGYDSNGNSYTGAVKIVVGKGDEDDSGYDVKLIKYSSDENENINFNGDDFNNLCESASSQELNYVKFTSLPSSTYGTLYYYPDSGSSKSKVATSTKCYYNSSGNSLSRIVFIPYSGYTGTFTIPYIAYNSNGDSYTGAVKLSIGDEEGAYDVSTIKYETDVNTNATFNEDNFNNLCKKNSGDELDYVKFTTLPALTSGILYYYSSTTSSTQLKITETTKLYYDSSDSCLSRVVFVPYSGFNGTVSIPYIGYDKSGKSFTGLVKITVGSGDQSDTAPDMVYSVAADSKFTLNALNFSYVCDQVKDTALSYVVFTPPSPSYGTLYYNYTSPTSYDSVTTAGAKYYYSKTPSISGVTFVPNSAYTGSFIITYIGYTENGDTFNGNIKVTVTAATTTPPTTTTDGSSKYFKDVGSDLSWASTQIDYLYEKGIVSGMDTGKYNPRLYISRGDFILMLVRAFSLTSSDAADNFPDVTRDYYKNAIATAKSLGIAQGVNGKFNPDGTLSRQDAMVLIKRTLDKLGKSMATADASILKSFSDYTSIKDYAYDAISTFVNAKIVKGDNNNKLGPTNSITRAEMAVLLYRVLYG